MNLLGLTIPEKQLFLVFHICMMKHLNLLNGSLKLFCQFVIRSTLESYRKLSMCFQQHDMGYALLKKIGEVSSNRETSQSQLIAENGCGRIQNDSEVMGSSKVLLIC